MQQAIEARDKETVAKLLGAGLDINSNLGEGLRAIHLAIRNNDRDMISFLQERGADVMVRSGDGSTPLHYAVKEWRPQDTPQEKAKTIEFLIRLGADVNAHDAKGVAPLDIAEAANQHTVAALLRRKNAKSGPGASILPKESPDITLKKHLRALQKSAMKEGIAPIITLLEAEDEEGLTKLARSISTGVARIDPEVACELLMQVGRLCAKRDNLRAANQLHQVGKPIAKRTKNATIQKTFASFQTFADIRDTGRGDGGGGFAKIAIGLVVVGAIGAGLFYTKPWASGPAATPGATPTAVATGAPTPGMTPTPAGTATPSAVETPTGPVGDPKARMEAAQKALEAENWAEAVREGGLALDAGVQGEEREAVLRIIAQGYVGMENYKGAVKVYEELKDEESLKEAKRLIALEEVPSLMSQANRGFRRGAADMALVSVDKAIKVLEENGGSDARKAEALDLRGQIALEVGKFQDASDSITKAVELAPENEDYQKSMAELQRASASRVSRDSIGAGFRFPGVGQGAPASSLYLLSDSNDQSLGGGGEYWLGDPRVTAKQQAAGEKSPPSLSVEVKSGKKSYSFTFRGDGKEVGTGVYNEGMTMNGKNVKGAFKVHEIQGSGGRVTSLAIDFHGVDDSGQPVFGRIRQKSGLR